MAPICLGPKPTVWLQAYSRTLHYLGNIQYRQAVAPFLSRVRARCVCVSTARPVHSPCSPLSPPAARRFSALPPVFPRAFSASHSQFLRVPRGQGGPGTDHATPVGEPPRSTVCRPPTSLAPRNLLIGARRCLLPPALTPPTHNFVRPIPRAGTSNPDETQTNPPPSKTCGKEHGMHEHMRLLTKPCAS